MEKQIKIMVRKCMRHLAKKDYELGITKLDIENAVAITRVVDKKWASATYADRRVIQINLSYWQHAEGRHYQREYKAFEKCHVIGGRWCDNLEQSLWLTVSHEVAHHVQYKKGPLVRWINKTYRKPHGQAFRQIYALLRSELVNPMLPDIKSPQ